MLLVLLLADQLSACSWVQYQTVPLPRILAGKPRGHHQLGVSLMIAAGAVRVARTRFEGWSVLG